MESRLTSYLRTCVNWSILCKLYVLFFYRKISSLLGLKHSHTHKKVLIIKLEVLGDFVIFIPALKAYAELYGGKNIDMLIDHGQNTLIADLLIKEGYINSYTLIDSAKFTRNFFYRFFISFKLRKNGYDVAIYAAYYRRNVGNFLVRVTDAPERFGFLGNDVESGRLPLDTETFTKTVASSEKPHEKLNLLPEYEKNFKLIEGIVGHPIERIEPYFPLTHFSEKDLNIELRQKMQTLGSRPYIIISPGSGRDYRRWPKERFAEVAYFAYQKGYAIVIAGGRNESKLAEDVEKHMYKISTENALIWQSEKVISVAGLTSPVEMAYITRSAKAIVTNDTGAIHIGAAVHIPSICIIGCGSYPGFFPYGDLNKNIAVVKLSPTCTHSWKCTETDEYIKTRQTLAPCIDNVTVETVEEALAPFL